MKSPLVREAFLAVPRELFIPEIVRDKGLAAIYEDAVFVTKTDSRGQAISSSSQPGIMAMMLDFLGLERGQRVLEVGAGTGYNAALIKHAVGPKGRVTAVDIDPDTAARARRALRTGGFGVKVHAADGHAGLHESAPFDRIIATTSSPTIPRAWFRQLRIGGLLVLPLRLAAGISGSQLAVALRKAKTGFESVAMTRAGFMGMRSAPGSDGPTFPIVGIYERVGGSTRGLAVQGRVIGTMSVPSRRRLLATLTGGPRRTQVARLAPRAFGGLVAFVATGADQRRVFDAGWACGVVARDGRGVAFLTAGEAKNGKSAVRIESFGTRAPERDLRSLVREWNEADRPEIDDLQIRASYGTERHDAWRKSVRDGCTLLFDWNGGASSSTTT